MFWLGLVAGIVAGANVGIIFFAILKSANK